MKKVIFCEEVEEKEYLEKIVAKKYEKKMMLWESKSYKEKFWRRIEGKKE